MLRSVRLSFSFCALDQRESFLANYYARKVTWNDYGESSYISEIVTGAIVSGAEGYVNGFPHEAFQFVLPYYTAAYKAGSRNVPITKEGALAWYRTTPAAACGTGGSCSQLRSSEVLYTRTNRNNRNCLWTGWFAASYGLYAGFRICFGCRLCSIDGFCQDWWRRTGFPCHCWNSPGAAPVQWSHWRCHSYYQRQDRYWPGNFKHLPGDWSCQLQRCCDTDGLIEL